MAGQGAALTVERVDGAKILVVEARYHAHINDMLIKGALRVIEEAGATATVVTVPGALEIPPAIALAKKLGGYDAFVALGCVIRGETTHYELVSEESCRGLMDLGINELTPVGNGILTVENEEQAIVRADPDDQDKGGGAAGAAISLLALARRLKAEAR